MMDNGNVQPPGQAPVVRVVTRRAIGQILVDLGRITHRDTQRIYARHRERGVPFGEAAVQLRLASRADVEQALSIQFNYPLLRPGDAGISPDVVVAFDTGAPAAEAVRELRSELLVRWLNDGRKALAVIGVGTGRGRGYIAANLAASFAQLGERTLLIDANLRAPVQHEYFRLPDGAGLSTVLNGGDRGEAVEAIPYFGTLSVLPCGPKPPNPLELLSRPAFRGLLDEVEREYDVIIIDTPPAARSADARTVAARAGSALLAIQRDADRVTDLRRLEKSLRDYGAALVGAVMVT